MRRIGADSLWYAMTKYIELTSKYIDEVTEELDLVINTNDFKIS